MELHSVVLPKETYTCPYGLNGREHIVHLSYSESFNTRDQIGMTNYIRDQLKKTYYGSQSDKNTLKKVLVPVKTEKPKNITFSLILMVKHSFEEKK